MHRLGRRAALITPLTWAAGLWAAEAPTAADAAGLAQLLAKLRSDLLQRLPKPAQVAQWEQALAASGLWADIDYADRTEGRWAPVTHLERLRGMAAQWLGSNADSAIRLDVAHPLVRGLQGWLARKPVSDNWWHNTIGQAQVLAHLLVLLHGRLPNELVVQACRLITTPQDVPPDRATGQNLVWYASQQLMRGVILDQARDVRIARGLLEATLAVTPDEGIQPDFSFHQHGPQLYSAGYGLTFAQDLARLGSLLADTPWAFGTAAVGNLADYVLNGICPLTRGAWLDWSARGREFTRLDRYGRRESVLQALRYVRAFAPTRTAALDAAESGIKEARPTSSAKTNHRYWRSDFMVHHTTAGYVSVKGCSSRTVGTESGNGENLAGFWLPFGVTYVARRGDEYDNMPWLWDWSSLPGVTCPAQVPRFSGYQRHDEPFVGGVSDGRSGAFAMRLNKLQTLGRKFWSFEGDWMVALGTDMSTAVPAPLRTTLNQCRRRGEVVTPMGALPLGEHRLFGPDLPWVWHDDVLYQLLAPANVLVGLAERSGHGQEVNRSMAPISARGQVFTMSVSHSNDAAGQYAYAIRTGATRQQAAARLTGPRLLANTPALQAVQHVDTGVVHATFHSAGGVQLNDRDMLEVDVPSVLLARPVGQGWAFCLTEPTRHLKRCQWRLLRHGHTVALGALELTTDLARDPQVTWTWG